MEQKTNLGIMLSIVIFIMSPSLALDFKIHKNNSKTLNAVMAKGAIEWNDMEKLDNFLSTLPSKKHTAIYFDSPGGNLGGGIKLGKYFHNNRIKTVIQGDKICASACALAFLGGTDRNGNKWMSTTTTSHLGFHAFRNANDIRYSNANEIQKTVAEILKYGQYVGASMEIFIHNFTTSSDNMYWFSTQETLSLGIKVWDMKKERFVKENNFGTKAGTGIYPNIDYACMTIHTYNLETGEKVKVSQREQQYHTLNVIDENKIKVGYFIYNFIRSDAGKDIYRRFYSESDLKGAYIDFKIGLGVKKNDKVIMPMYFHYYDQEGRLGLTDDGICSRMETMFPQK